MLKHVATVVAVLMSAAALAFQLFGNSSGDVSNSLAARMARLIAERQELTNELSRDPFAEAGKSPLEAYLVRIRRDGVPPHANMRRKLAQIADDNSQILALAEAYETLAKSPNYPMQLRALRTYVITWNDRWYSVFETFMAGGNLTGGEPAFPEGFLSTVEVGKK